MNVVGIIAEYNPFHRGHAYQIQKLKEICHADYIIIAMSGNFVQRGAPALMDKYSRARMALSLGADLVLELPALFSCASAELFALGGVSLPNSTGIVTHLGFGAETDNLPVLSELAAILFKEPASYRHALHRALKKGCSFPAARAAALQASISGSDSPDSSLSKILAGPNNILALEYLKALAARSSNMIPVPILRRGKGYHDTELDEDFCSASGIRAQIKRSLQNGTLSQHTIPNRAVPDTVYKIIRDYPHPFLFEDDFSMLLHYKLLTRNAHQLAACGNGSLELANRIIKERDSFTGWNAFCRHIKTKNITYTRLSRLFLHMLLDITQKDYEQFSNPSYLRILGFRNAAAPLLTALKNCPLPVITNLSNASRLLPAHAQKLLAIDLRAFDLYRVGLTFKSDNTMKNDYRQQVIRF